MDCYGLIGFPLTHSFSAQFFTEKFRLENIDAEYLNFEIEDILEIRRVILFNQYLRGLNVTIPYKEKVIPFLHKLSPDAEKIGAVNTIKIDRVKGDMYFYELTGYNTDYIGFKNSLSPLIKPEVHKKALILGTGGASKAIAYALTSMDIEWICVSRKKGEGLISYDELTSDIMSESKLVINTTPLGTYPDIENCPSIPYSLLTEEHLLYDLVYNPEETLFLRNGQKHGAGIKNGKEMLVLQALEAWRIWNFE